MLTDLLWFWEAKMQYERQKAQGLAGLMSILAVLLVIWKWEEWFYPFFNKIGFIGLAERTGLVSDLSILTVINIIAIIFLLSIFIAAICFAVVVIGVLLLLFGASKIGQTIIVIALLPILIPFYIFQRNKINKNVMKGAAPSYKDLKNLKKKYKNLHQNDKMLRFYLEQMKNTDDHFNLLKWDSVTSYEEVKAYLNKVLPSIKDNTDFLFAYHKGNNKLYLAFPNPLPKIASTCFSSERTYGLYGFESCCYNLLGYSDDYYKFKSDYSVPALECTIGSNGEELTLELTNPGDVQSLDISGSIDFYKVYSTSIKERIRKISNTNMRLFNILNRAHMAFYLIPIAYKNDMNFKKGFDIYVEESKHVLNGDILEPIYKADIESIIIDHAKSGSSWAKVWFLKVE